jgi:hypothetical protein
MQYDVSTETLQITHTHNQPQGLIELVLLCLANGRLFYISEDCTRRDRDRRVLKSGLECNLAKLGLLLAKTGGRPTGRPTTLSQLLLLPVEAKLCDRSRSGIERDSLSRSRERDRQTDLQTKPNRRDTSHHVTAFRNTDRRLFVQPSVRQRATNVHLVPQARAPGLAAHYGQTTTKIVTTELHSTFRTPPAVFTTLTSRALL